MLTVIHGAQRPRPRDWRGLTIARPLWMISQPCSRPEHASSQSFSRLLTWSLRVLISSATGFSCFRLRELRSYVTLRLGLEILARETLTGERGMMSELRVPLLEGTRGTGGASRFSPAWRAEGAAFSSKTNIRDEVDLDILGDGRG